MKNIFTAVDVFEIAEKIEINGMAFYQATAERFTNPQAKHLLLDLAEKEKDHRRRFAILKDRYIHEPGEAPAPVADAESLENLRTLAETHVFLAQKDSGVLKGSESTEEIIFAALNFEKDSIVYFLGVKDFVDDENDKRQVDKIIYEEVEHIGDLSRMLRELI